MPEYAAEAFETMAVDAQRLREVLLDLGDWYTWLPWLRVDPDIVLEVEGAAGSPAQRLRWHAGRESAGEVLLEGGAADSIACRLRQTEPTGFEGSMRFTLADAGRDGTTVQWRLAGRLPWLRALGVAHLEDTLRADQARGLRLLRDRVELGRVPSCCEAPRLTACGDEGYVGFRVTVPFERLGAMLDAGFDRVRRTLEQRGTRPSGPAFALYDRQDRRHGECTVIACWPFAGDLGADRHLVRGRRQAATTLSVVHTGAFRHLPNAWARLRTHIARSEHRIDRGSAPFERYLDDPATTAEEARRTEVHFPLRPT